MHAKSLGLVWIVAKDFKKTVKFYTDIVGLKLLEMNEEWGWAELEGKDGEGMRLGIAQDNPECQSPVQPGQNAVMTFTVSNIEKSSKEIQKQGATLVGAIETVPGHVKMQTVKDSEGNFFQLVEIISEEKEATTKKSGCCAH